jgi:uncharacterized protein (TIGR02145 family)
MKKITECCLVIIYLIAGTILSGCKKENVPTVRTTPVSIITGVNATSGGTITDEGSSSIIIRGVCWSTDVNPTIADNKTIDGRGIGSFSSNLTGLNVDVVYYIRAYAANSVGTGYGRVVSFISFGQSPTATTSSVANIEATTATLIGNVVANNLSTVVTLEYGTTTSYGTTVTAAQSPLTGVTTFSVNADIAGLTEATIYHFRVKAVNSLGTTYGSDLTFTTLLADVEGNTYNTINIGTQVWMQENLRTTRYRNGNLIGTTSPATLDITNLIIPKYQWECTNVNYGRFYTYYAITDSRNVCPAGWHVPTDNDWTTLTYFLTNNGYGFAGSGNDIAKSLAATSGFIADTTAGNVGNDQASNNSSGFTGLPSGGRFSTGIVNFVNLHGIWWSSTEGSPTFAYFRCIGYIPAQVYRGIFSESYGLPVRCLRD